MMFNYPQRGETMNQEQTQETPKLSTINQVPQDIQNILEETRLSIDAIKKNSKLRMHYLRAIMMNNILRAFAVKYHLEEKYLNTQKALLDALLRVEARPGRQWLTNEKIALADAFNFFREILESSSSEQLIDILYFVDENRTQGKWVVYKRKNVKS